MSDHIQVRFPDKVQVTSPEIDSLNQVAQRISNWLHADLKKIVEPLQVLPGLKETLDRLHETIVRQFRDIFNAQFTLEMKSREANLRVAEAKAKLAESHLEKKKIQVQEAGKRISSRYEKIASQVAREHEVYLRQLDSHAYELLDAIYPEEIQAKFSFESVPYWAALAAHAEGSAMIRSACLQEGYAAARSLVTEFLAARRRFEKDLESLSVNDVDDGPLALPFWFVEVEDMITGERYTEIVFLWELDKNQAPMSEELLQALSREAEAQIDWSRATALAPSDWVGIEKKLRTQYDLSGEELLRLVVECQKAYFD